MTPSSAGRPETDSDSPLTTERQLAKQLAASHRATMLLHGELERFLTEALGADDVRRPNLLNWAEHMVASTVRMQGMHHDGVRTLMYARNEGKRLVDVTHHVDRPRGS
jgi:hypothetical protein